MNGRRAIWYEYVMSKEKGFIAINGVVELQAMIEANQFGIRQTPRTTLINTAAFYFHQNRTILLLK